jgi:ferrochelatase
VKRGVLLVNSGTPATLATRDVRAFLAGLLGDPRVVELPRWLWLPILHGIILRVRPRASAKKYAAIWTPQGSPLAIESEALRHGLEASLREDATPVALAMLYTGGDTVTQGIDRLRKAGVEDIIVLPMFPQYCGASSGAVFDQVSAALRALRHVPAMRFISSYHDHPGYIAALAASVQDHQRASGVAQHLLMSFHGIPEQFVARGDPYRAQCERTAALLAQKLALPADGWSVSFQSRFGRAQWLQPYTSEVLASMPKRGIDGVSVICPGFAADCLETLEEIGMENRDVFLGAGGKKYSYVPALNARADHVAALRAVVSQSGE